MSRPPFGGHSTSQDNALDTGGIEIASHGKRCDPLAPCLNSLPKRKKDTGGTKAGLFFKLPYGSRFCCFIIAKFALRDGPAVGVLVAPEWSAIGLRPEWRNMRMPALRLTKCPSEKKLNLLNLL
jgi:hypothetical protein